MNKYSKNKSFKAKPFGFLLAVLSIAIFGLGVIILLIWHLKNKAEKLTITESEIKFEQGLLNKQHTEISITSVRTVKIKQNFIERVLGVGTIEIYTAGDTPEFIAIGMPKPNIVREIIKNNEQS